jgi:hypothetical protein
MHIGAKAVAVGLIRVSVWLEEQFDPAASAPSGAALCLNLPSPLGPNLCVSPVPSSRRLGRARLVLKLRALDTRLAGETYREIARVLSAGSRRLEDRTWKSHDLRSWIIRLVKDGERLMRAGYRDLVQRG